MTEDEYLAEIHALRQKNEELQRAIPEWQGQLAAIIESSDDAVVSKDLDGIVRTWNTGAERIFGWTSDEVVGRPINIIIPPERQDEEPKILARLRRGDRVDHFETVRVAKDGRRIDVSVTISPVRDHRGAIVAASKIARDITAQKQFARELGAAKEKAESANRAKDDFLMHLSHELRTPLTPVLAHLSYLEVAGDLSGEMAANLAMIRRNVETEARLLDDLLDVSRIAHGKLQLHCEVVDLHHSIRNVVAMVEAQMEDKAQELVLGLRAARHAVWGDAGRMQQVLLNLIANAVKFTPVGGRISVRTSNSDDGGRVRVEIGDSGIGIAPEYLPRLFRSFEQARHGHQFGGLGLGLTISKSLVEMHDGTIHAASAGSGQGTTMTVELATTEKSLAAPRPEVADGRRANGLRVLLVEDHSDTREVMGRLLRGLGCVVREASGVREAVALGKEMEFDLLLCDLGLPDGSGLEVMRQLKGGRMRGMALSGYGQEGDIERSLEAGFEGHITKPVNFAELRAAVLKQGR